MTNIAFEAFACHTFTNSEGLVESRWLKADVSIQCGTDEHNEAIALSWMAILLYPIGLLALCGGLLFAARSAILTKRPTALSRAISFLWFEFEPHFFWWECVEMLRRLVLVGLMVLAQGSIMQLVFGTLLSVVFLLFQVQAAPYAAMDDDFLASALNFGLVAIFLSSIAFKYDELIRLDDFDAKMSIEQKDYYIVSQSLLVFIMTVGVLGAMILSFVLFLMQFTFEVRRQRHEALAAKARRLRNKENNEMVQAPRLKEGHFHVFLSHVWASGQDQMRVVKTVY